MPQLVEMPRLGVNHLTLAESVYQELRAWIATGRIEPGAKLSTVELAASMAVSRTPVADAVARLESEGLLASLGKTGFAVPILSIKEVENLHDGRLICQLYALKTSLPMLTDAQIEDIRAQLGAYPYETLDEVVRRRGSGIGALIMNLVDNATVKGWHERAEFKLQPYRLLFHENLTPEHSEIIRLDHERILDALQTRDWPTIEATITQHTQRTLQTSIVAVKSLTKAK